MFGIPTTAIRPRVGRLTCPLFLTALLWLPLPALAQDGPVSALFAQPVLAAEIFNAQGDDASAGVGTDLVSERMLNDWSDQANSRPSPIRPAAAESEAAERSTAISGAPRTSAETKSSEFKSAAALWYTQPDSPEPLDLQALVLRLVLGTAGVLAACVVSLWVARRWLKNGSTSAASSGQIELIESMALANRCSVQLIQVDQRRLLIGMDATGLKTIVPLRDPFANTLDAVDEEVSHSAEFSEPLNAALATSGKTP